MRAAAVTTAAAVAVLGLLAGCGGQERRSPDEPDVRAAIDRYARGVAAKDYQGLCDLLAPELLDRIRAGGLPCELALKTGLDEVREPTLQLLDVRVNGATATARVRTDAANQPASEDTLGLVLREGRWKIASLASG